MAGAANKTTTLFSMRVLRRSWELVPLVGIVTTASVVTTAFGIYMLVTKPDVMVNKSSHIPPWERLDVTKPQVLMHYKTKYEAIPELEALRKEIGSYKY